SVAHEAPRRLRMRTHLLAVALSVVFLAPAQADLPTESTTDNSSTGSKIENLWSDLADPDAVKAYRAMWSLTKTPEETVTYIAQHLKPEVAPDQEKVEGWIKELGSDTFVVREKARLELMKWGDLVERKLRKALQGNPALETR